MTPIAIHIPGRAVPVRKDRAEGVEWRDMIQHQAQFAMVGRAKFAGPVSIFVAVSVERPAYQTTAFPSRWCALDYADTVLDALCGVAFDEPGQIAHVSVHKGYTDAPAVTTVTVAEYAQ